VRSSKVAKRYARALAGLSSGHVQLETWGAELERLARVVTHPDIELSFASPEISPKVKLEALAKIAETLELSFPVRSFSVVVARHGRIQDLPAIAEAYRRMLDDLMGRARATLTFAQAPADTDLARVLAELEAISHKKIIPTVNVDNSLLGGVIVELEGKIYDGSLANRLAEAQRRLAG
jgi:F-type H+-transporting ATPase subunit delta